MLPANTQELLLQLLQALSAADNAVRTAAEDQLNTAWVASRPEVLLMGLAEQIAISQEPSVGCQSLLPIHTLTTHQDSILRFGIVPKVSFKKYQASGQ